jgi:2-polyprenyl-6-methoxyphenol hydroxylase-like FAD-dependent oxidoreductase
MGLASGLLDAGSLAEVLISHLQRGAEEKVLDSWATARRANFLELVDSLSRASFWELQDSDVDSLPNRHPILKSLKAGPGMRPPAFATDVTKLDGYVA